MGSLEFEDLDEDLNKFAEVSKLLLGDGKRPVRLLILFLLVEDPEISRDELARRLGLTPQTVSTHMGVLESSGLLEVRRSPEDLRRKVYRPTRMGVEVLNIISRTGRELSACERRHLPLAERQLADIKLRRRALLRRMERTASPRERRKLERQLKELDRREEAIKRREKKRRI